MSRVRTYRSWLLAGFLAAPAVALSGSAVHAEKMVNEQPSMNPLMAWAEMMQPRDEFTLTSDTDVELVRFNQPHILSVCDAHEPHGQIGATRHAYPIMIKWGSDTATIEPGNCFAFDAQRVTVRPAGHLPQNDMIVGTIRIIH